MHRDRPRNHELPFSLFDDGSSHQVVGICVQSRIVQRCVHFRMHAPRRTQARSTAESRIDNIIELLRFLATVAMLRLTSLVSNNCFILTRNSSVIVGIVIVVQARFIISDGQGKYQTKLKQRMKVARCSSIDRYTERSLGRTVLEIIVEVVDHTASAKFKVHFRLPSETQRLRFLSSSPSYVSKANNEAL